MKKITLSVLAIAASFAMNAQEFAATANTPATGTYNYGGGSVVVWDQPSAGGSGIVSDFNVDEGFGVWSADDFELTFDNTQIDKITAFGFQNNGNLTDLIISVEMNIYNNLDGANVPDGNPTLPGTGAAEISIPLFDPGLEVTEVDGFEFVVTTADAGLDIVLPAGNYWLVASPSLSGLVGMDGPSRWNWFDAGVPAAGLTEAHLIDPTDFFGAGATNWTPFSGLGLTFGSTAFVIEGTELILGVNGIALENQVAIFPNPASDVVNIKLASNITVDSVVVYDVLGKVVNADYANDQLNVSTLSRGVYVINVNTNRGTLTQKFVKN